MALTQPNQSCMSQSELHFAHFAGHLELCTMIALHKTSVLPAGIPADTSFSHTVSCRPHYSSAACRDLSKPFVEELEALIEDHNPNYQRSCKQRTQDKWEPQLTQDGLFALVEYSVHPNPLPMRSTHDGEHAGWACGCSVPTPRCAKHVARCGSQANCSLPARWSSSLFGQSRLLMHARRTA